MPRHKGKSVGGDFVGKKRDEREESAAGGGNKTATVDTELGLAIEMSEADKLAEGLAVEKDSIDVATENLKNHLEDLQAAMHRENRKFVKARTAGGIIYTFELARPEEKVKIKKVND